MGQDHTYTREAKLQKLPFCPSKYTTYLIYDTPGVTQLLASYI